MEEVNSGIREGLHLDFDPENQPKDTYRNSINGEIFEVGTNKFKWAPKTGNALSFSITADTTLIGGFSIIDKLMVFATDNTNHEIGYVVFDSAMDATYFRIFYHSDLNFSNSYPITGKGNKENPDIVRGYWRDGLNHPRVLNLIDIVYTIAQPYFPTLTAYTDYLNVGTSTYIISPGNEVAPGEVLNHSVDIIIDPTLYKFVKYIPVNTMQWVPEAESAILKYDSSIEGALLYGSYFVTYRLGLDTGYVTNWQNPIGPINVIDFDEGLDALTPIDNANLYQNTQGKSHLITSTRGIRLSLTDIDQEYDYVEICSFHCKEKDTIEEGRIVTRDEITDTEMLIDFKYNFTLGSVSIADVITKNVVLKDIIDMDILKYRMDVGGTFEKADLDIGQQITGARIRSETYEFCIDHRGRPDLTDTEAGLVSATIRKVSDPTYNRSIVEYIEPGQRYQVQGTAGTVGYNGNTYQIGDVIIGEAKATSYTHSGDTHPQPVLMVRKYHNWSTGADVYDYHNLDKFYDYKDPTMALYGKGHWGNQKYRYGLLAMDEYLNPMFVRFLDDFLTPQRDKATTRETGYQTIGNKRSLGQYVGGVWYSDSEDTALVKEYDQTTKKNYTGRALSTVIDNLDLTDIIDDIHAFAIVRLPREKTIISEGWIEPVISRGFDPDIFGVYPEIFNIRFRPNYLKNITPTPAAPSVKSTRVPYWYTYIDPAKIFDKGEEASIQEDDLLMIKRYMDNNTATMESLYEQYHKCYDERDPASFFVGATPIDSSTTIKHFRVADIDVDRELIVDPAESSNIYKNVNDVSVDVGVLTGVLHMNVGGKAVVVKTDYDGIGYGFGYWPETNSTQSLYLPIVQHLRAAIADYGGTSSYNLQSSQYIFTNHFQIIDQEFRDAIADDPNNPTTYIASGIQIFGGDCFVNIFDYKRSMVRYGLWGWSRSENPPRYYPNTTHYGESIFVPLQSEMNIALRLYRHIAKNRSYSTADGVTIYFGEGIAYEDLTYAVTPSQWENYLYDDSYSSEQVGISFPGTPERLNNNDTFTETIRYSLRKTLGEKIDKYRIFQTNNKIDLNQDGGAISAVIGFKDRLFYWQEYICGYIPVGERMMAQTEMGMPVQLGIGGIFERVDDISKFFGLHSKFALAKTEYGFVWFDVNKKAWIDMKYDSGIQEESIIKGLSNKFQSLASVMRTYSNPVLGEGIYLVYCQNEKTIWGSFMDPINASLEFTIGYNTAIQKFTSFYNFKHFMGLNLAGDLFTTIDGVNLYQHGIGDIRKFYGDIRIASIEIIVNPNPQYNKAFLNGELVSTPVFFDQVTYTAYGKTIQSEVEDVSLFSSNYESRLGYKWLFNFPFTSVGRLQGLYLSITFSETDTTVGHLPTEIPPQINELKTFFNYWL